MRREDGITVEIARRKRKLADAKESRQWADGVVSTSAKGARERTSSFVRPYENENYEMEKELERSWGRNGRGNEDGDRDCGTRERLQF